VLTNLQNILLVDVREPDEVALGSIPSSVCLPLSQLRDALDSNYNAGEFQKVSATTAATTENSAISRAASSPLHPHSHLFHVPGITPPPWCGVVWCGVVWCGVGLDDRADLLARTSPSPNPSLRRTSSSSVALASAPPPPASGRGRRVTPTCATTWGAGWTGRSGRR
jgi:hypothetical protein